MNDADARRLLAGIDAPRPLPDGLAGRIADRLLDEAPELASIDAPRPLPDDLRHRLEATLLTAAAEPVPRRVRRGVLARTRRAPSVPRRLVAAAAAIALVAGLGVVASVERGGDGVDIAGSLTTVPSPGSAGAGGGTGSASGAGATGIPFGPPVVADPTAAAAGSGGGGGSASGATGDSGATAAPAAGGVQAGAISVDVTGGDTDIAAGFLAYLRVLNAAGGVAGRQVATDDAPGGAVATVNLAASPQEAPVDGVVFETAFVDDARLRDRVVSLASAADHQARLAVAHALADDAAGRRAVVYTSPDEPWATVVPDAIDAALAARGATAIRVPFRAEAPAFVPADLAFLSLSPADAAAWITAAPGAPSGGVWGVGSAWDDGLAGRAADLSLRVLSPYAPVGGDEEAALRRELGSDLPLTAGAVHGWVTAKAVALLLDRNGGAVLTAADLDALAGFDHGWAPPFDTRAGTRSRTPDAVVLRPDRDRFVADGTFAAAE